jgi:hypothetical protein
MNLLLRGIVILLCFELGVLLILVPWSPYWSNNYFLIRYPELIPFLLDNRLRGAITGLGLMDVLIALSLIRRPSVKKAAASPDGGTR